MTEHSSFYRKITYLVLIAILLFPLSQLGAPETREDEGGKLAQLRRDYDLGQAQLGEIDPTSEAMRMATLGARGIAVSLLWTKANEFKKKEDWTNFRATLNQLAKLQPYFISFWRFQSWNLTYNVSVELDDVRDRFHYVKRGIEFLKQGTQYIRESPYLLSELGWFIGNKIGKADEKAEYRRMFKLDDDFHNEFFDNNPPPRENRDNWLVSRSQYERAVSAVDDKKKSLGQKNPTTFFAAPGMSQIHYCGAIELEGTFGEKAKKSWATAEDLWQDYGNRDLLSSRGFYIRLAELENHQEKYAELQEELESIIPELRKKIEEERQNSLTADERYILDNPQDLTDEQQQEYFKINGKLKVTFEDIAERIAKEDSENASRARRLANQMGKLKSRISLTDTNRSVVNYEYWKFRCELEQTAVALEARELAYAAKRAFRDKADLIESKRLYEESFDRWAEIVDTHPNFLDDTTTGSEIIEFVHEYVRVLSQLDKSLSDEDVDQRFPLWELVEINDGERKYVEEIAEHKRRLEREGLDLESN